MFKSHVQIVKSLWKLFTTILQYLIRWVPCIVYTDVSNSSLTFNWLFCWERIWQRLARSIYSISRREFLLFNLTHRDKTRIFDTQSQALRQDRENVLQSQALRWDQDLLSSISDFESRTRIKIKTNIARILVKMICFLWLNSYFPKKGLLIIFFLNITSSFISKISKNLNANCFEIRSTWFFRESLSSGIWFCV